MAKRPTRKKHAKKPPKPGPFGITWSRGPQSPIVDFLGGAPKKPMFPPRVVPTVPPKSLMGVRPPRRKKVTKAPDEIRKRKIFGGVHVAESRIGGEPIERGGTAHVLPRYWQPSTDIPLESYIPSDTKLPPGVEAIIDLSPSDRGIYPLLRAKPHNPDHEHDKSRDYWICRHSRNASSWFSCIGLVVLASGQLGLYAQTWKGTELAWVWPNDDHCIEFYQMMKAAPSKGKFCRGKYGPSFLYHQPYILLSGA